MNERIEWSGLAADYSPDEQAIVRRLSREVAAAPESEQGWRKRELRIIHEAKAVLDATLTEQRDEQPPIEQSELFPIPDRVIASRAYARTTDPGTSHAAARSITEDALRDSQAAVLACYREHGAMHHEQLVTLYGAHGPQRGWPRQAESGLRTRTSELVDAGYVRDSGRTVKLPSGRSSIVWAAA